MLLLYMDSTIGLNFTVVFLLTRKTWNDRFTGKVRENKRF